MLGPKGMPLEAGPGDALSFFKGAASKVRLSDIHDIHEYFYV